VILRMLDDRGMLERSASVAPPSGEQSAETDSQNETGSEQ
jgi:hypothetical protein